MGKIKNYRPIHNTDDHYHYAWEHEPTGEILAVMDHEYIHDNIVHDCYTIVRMRPFNVNPRSIIRLVMAKNRARQITADIARKNPTGLFNGLNVPVWGEGHTVKLALGHVAILEKHVDPCMDDESLKAHLRQRGHQKKAEEV